MKLQQFKLLVLFVIFTLSTLFAQKKELSYEVGLNGGLSSEENLPFWMTVNKFGTIPNSDYLLLSASLFSEFQQPEKNFDFSYKGSFSGYLADVNHAIVNELYMSLRFKNWLLDVGNKYDELNYGGLSSSNGNFVKSTNSRAFPGFNIKTMGFITLPVAKKWFAFKLNLANYWLNDDRVVDGAMLQHSSLFFKFKFSDKLNLVTGIDHYAQWGGTSPEFGKQPSSFKDFIKIFFAQGGGNTINDQENALGNHLGAYLINLNGTYEKLNWSFYLSHPFEDHSGLNFSNYPDGLFGLFFDFKKPENFISHLVLEYTNTTDQGRKSSTNDLIDNYFNNSIYGSGWTYFGRIIGTPFFQPEEKVDGITPGVSLDYSRFKAYHIGLKGYISQTVNYRAHFNYTYYPGWFYAPISSNLYSTSIEFDIHLESIPFEITAGAAGDFGDFGPSNVGGFISLSKRGIF